MKTFKSIFFILIGFISIVYSLKLLLNGSQELIKVIAGISFGILFIYPSLKQDSKTETEIFIDKEDILVPIWWKRFLGFIIDFLIISVIYSLTMVTLDNIYTVRINFNPVILWLPFMVFYYSIQELLFNTTIGKSIFRLMVISISTGEKLTLLQVIIRTISRLIPLDIFFFFTKRPVGLHDILSKTVVVTKISG